MSQLDMTAGTPSTPTDQPDTDAMTDFAPVPGTELHALAVTYRLRVLEWKPADTPIDGFLAHYLEHKDGRRFLVVPADQDPAERLHAVRALLSHQAVTA